MTIVLPVQHRHSFQFVKALFEKNRTIIWFLYGAQYYKEENCFDELAANVISYCKNSKHDAQESEI